VIGYIYDPTTVDPDRSIEFYPVAEVAHWSPVPDPMANFRGMSWLTPVIREINADTAMTEHRDSYFRNAATPNLILKYAAQLTQQQKDAIAEQASARHGGPANAFRTMVLDSGADPMVVGSNLNDSAFASVQAAGENRIAVAGGVSAIVVGLKEGLAAATLANYDAAVRFTVDWTFRPNWRSACAALQKLLKVPPGTQLWFDTSDIAALQAGEQEKASTFATDAATADGLIQSGWTPESVKTAIGARDMSLLVHTGLYSVQLQAPGAAQPEPAAPSPNGKPVPATVGG
jgi:phage portal protein BeeE